MEGILSGVGTAALVVIGLVFELFSWIYEQGNKPMNAFHFLFIVMILYLYERDRKERISKITDDLSKMTDKLDKMAAVIQRTNYLVDDGRF
jgi:hypothetical protein